VLQYECESAKFVTCPCWCQSLYLFFFLCVVFLLFMFDYYKTFAWAVSTQLGFSGSPLPCLLLGLGYVCILMGFFVLCTVTKKYDDDDGLHYAVRSPVQHPLTSGSSSPPAAQSTAGTKINSTRTTSTSAGNHVTFSLPPDNDTRQQRLTTTTTTDGPAAADEDDCCDRFLRNHLADVRPDVTRVNSVKPSTQVTQRA